MFGLDLGLGYSSITLLGSKRSLLHSLVLKGDRGPSEDGDDYERIVEISDRILTELAIIHHHHSVKETQNRKFVIRAAVEKPIYSWGRRNPKVFEKSIILYALVRYGLRELGIEVIPVNPQEAKRVANAHTHKGKEKKQAMIKAYIDARGVAPGHRNQKGRETLADSYFIAIAGLELRKK